MNQSAQQHWLRDLGLITQPVRETAEPERSKNGRTKTPRQAYCRLSKDQMQKLIEHIKPIANSYQTYAEQIYESTPIELLTSTNGNVMKWLTFRKLIENIRRGIDATTRQKKYIIIRMINAGRSIDQIIEKHPDISKKYAQEIIRQIKQARAENDHQ